MGINKFIYKQEAVFHGGAIHDHGSVVGKLMGLPGVNSETWQN
jgi:hypothetical protein